MPYSDPDKRKEYYRDYMKTYRATPERKAAQRVYDKDRYKNLPSVRRATRNRALKRYYGITIDEYERLLQAQGDTCAICGEVFKNQPHLDHAHDSKVLREFLCELCNKGLGQFKDNPMVLEKAAAYLRKHGK